ncbi:polysaccharide deacetylase family protein [Anaerobacillus alkaliphilus]|uniref:Polysaccharide deacetylase family protein n=1 Tax=Anaerobacillus alkaliphilus TaxID=1548597 RepID=A0A4Q0VP00_9BACI|nr:polysaccharide deacetylase family protein [Anaerobacillus alkaliphilus]RXI98162.1 polysaccharide deacetylase family protein [Anaerobacillus alkaliphilus]
MKKLKNAYLLLSMVFILSACVTETNQNQEGEKTSEVVQPEIEIIIEEVTVDEIEVNETGANDVIEASARYILESDHTVKPLKESESDRVVLLTIDDAPNRYSVEMAKLLHEKNINAIFFVNGHFIQSEEGKAKLKNIHDLGFEIGNHTMTHPNLRKLSDEQQRQEIIELNDLIEDITGTRPRFFRAPFGVNTDTSKQVVKEESMQWMNWTYGYDFEKDYMEKDALAEIMVNTNLLRPGANLLMHDHLWTLEALPLIIRGLQEKGYDFVNPKEIK